MILRARTLWPVARPPIADGAILTLKGRIRAVGRWRDLRPHGEGETRDLGAVALLPGFVNAHAHLEYGHLAGRIPPPRSFTAWLQSMVAFKAASTRADFADSWSNTASALLDRGTTTVADVQSAPVSFEPPQPSIPLRAVPFLELIDARSPRPPSEMLEEALARLCALAPRHPRGGLSPHAPYSASPQLLELCATAARGLGLRLMIHLAESREEFDMFAHARGPLYDWLRHNHRDMSDCGQGSPVRHLARLGCLSENLIAVHVNYLAPGDATLLARRGVHLVHCPRSHAYFQHAPFPLEEFQRAGLNVCLGTDSLATVRADDGEAMALDPLADMRLFARRHPGVSPEFIVRMVTLNGARALGLEGQAGELSESAWADLIALPYAGAPGDVAAAVLEHRGQVHAVLTRGRWAVPPPN